MFYFTFNLNRTRLSNHLLPITYPPRTSNLIKSFNNNAGTVINCHARLPRVRPSYPRPSKLSLLPRSIQMQMNTERQPPDIHLVTHFSKGYVHGFIVLPCLPPTDAAVVVTGMLHASIVNFLIRPLSMPFSSFPICAASVAISIPTRCLFLLPPLLCTPTVCTVVGIYCCYFRCC